MITQEQKFNLVQMVQDIYNDFVAAFNRADADAVAELYTNDAVLFPTDNPMVKGKENIRLFWTEELKTHSGLTLTVQDVKVQGDLLVEYGTYTMIDNNDPENPRTFAGKYVVTWKNIDGNWKLHWDIFNPD